MRMNQKERIDNFIKLIEDFRTLMQADRNYTKKEELISVTTKLQREAKIVRTILRNLNISLTGVTHGRSFDYLHHALEFPETNNRGDGYMFDFVQGSSMKLLRQALNSAAGYLEYTTVVDDEVILSSIVDDAVKNHFLNGDYGAACSNLFKKLKDKIHSTTGTENISQAIGILKKKLDYQEKDAVKEDFLSGVNNILHALNYFRNVEFHS